MYGDLRISLVFLLLKQILLDFCVRLKGLGGQYCYFYGIIILVCKYSLQISSFCFFLSLVAYVREKVNIQKVIFFLSYLLHLMFFFCFSCTFDIKATNNPLKINSINSQVTLETVTN